MFAWRLEQQDQNLASTMAYGQLWDGGRSVTLGNWKLAPGGGSAVYESFLDVAPFAVSEDGLSGGAERASDAFAHPQRAATRASLGAFGI